MKPGYKTKSFYSVKIFRGSQYELIETIIRLYYISEARDM